jgi:hypothetical protein
MPADPEKKALAERLVREEKARWKEEWLEGQRLKRREQQIVESVTATSDPDSEAASHAEHVILCREAKAKAEADRRRKQEEEKRQKQAQTEGRERQQVAGRAVAPRTETGSSSSASDRSGAAEDKAPSRGKEVDA